MTEGSEAQRLKQDPRDFFIFHSINRKTSIADSHVLAYS